MESLGLGIYILMFPVIGAIVLVIVLTAVYREFISSRRSDEEDLV